MTRINPRLVFDCPRCGAESETPLKEAEITVVSGDDDCPIGSCDIEVACSHCNSWVTIVDGSIVKK